MVRNKTISWTDGELKHKEKNGQRQDWERGKRRI